MINEQPPTKDICLAESVLKGLSLAFVELYQHISEVKNIYSKKSKIERTVMLDKYKLTYLHAVNIKFADSIHVGGIIEKKSEIYKSIQRASGEMPGNFKTQRIRAGNSSGQGERKSEDVQSDENS